MPFEKKRDKQLSSLLPAVKHLVKREFCVQSLDVSDALKKKKQLIPDDPDSDNYSLDNDSHERSSMDLEEFDSFSLEESEEL